MWFCLSNLYPIIHMTLGTPLNSRVKSSQSKHFYRVGVLATKTLSLMHHIMLHAYIVRDFNIIKYSYNQRYGDPGNEGILVILHNICQEFTHSLIFQLF